MPGGRAGRGGGARSSAHGAAGPRGAGRQAQRERDGARPGRGSSLPPRAWSLQPPLLSRVTPGRWHYGTWVQGDGPPRARARGELSQRTGQVTRLRVQPKTLGPRPASLVLSARWGVGDPPAGVGRRRRRPWRPRHLTPQRTPHPQQTSPPGSPLLSVTGSWSPQVEEFEHDVPEDLGPLQFVKLRKHHSLVDDAWFCDRITVQGPGAGEEAAFPCYRWVQGEGVMSLPEGTGDRLPRGPGCRAGAPGGWGRQGIALRRARGA